MSTQTGFSNGGDVSDKVGAGETWLSGKSGSSPNDAFLRALSEALLEPFQCADGAQKTTLVDQVSAFLAAQRRGLPHVLPFAMGAACLAMDLSTLATRRQRFRKLPLSVRLAVLDGWRRSPLSSVRNFLKFHEVFASYVHYARGQSA